jgi:hypothetical protein
MATAVGSQHKKEQPMKAILLLNDETAPPRSRLQNVAGGKVTVRPSEGTPGCNCDRWGHPCPNCVEYKVQPKAELPISTPAENDINTWNT